MEHILENEGYALVGAAMEVYNELGNGFLEDVYQDCLEIELNARRIPFVAQLELRIVYKGKPIQRKYRPDLLVYGEIIVELKAIKNLTNNEYAQLLNYLKTSGKRVGYLLNFGSEKGLEWKRFIL